MNDDIIVIKNDQSTVNDEKPSQIGKDFHNTKVECFKYDVDENMFLVKQRYTLVRNAPKGKRQKGLKQYKIDDKEWICVTDLQDSKKETPDVHIWTVTYVYVRRSLIHKLLGCLGNKKVKWLINVAKVLNVTKSGTTLSYSAVV